MSQACSVCYGSGRTIDGKPCPFHCGIHRPVTAQPIELTQRVVAIESQVAYLMRRIDELKETK